MPDTPEPTNEALLEAHWTTYEDVLRVERDPERTIVASAETRAKASAAREALRTRLADLTERAEKAEAEIARRDKQSDDAIAGILALNEAHRLKPGQEPFSEFPGDVIHVNEFKYHSAAQYEAAEAELARTREALTEIEQLPGVAGMPIETEEAQSLGMQVERAKEIATAALAKPEPADG